MAFRTEQHITRAMVRREPKTLFVFGDNVKRTGKGGQASQMRGEPNVVGIVTKWLPTRDESAYFRDDDLPVVEPLIHEAFNRLAQHLSHGGDVVWPVEGVGTGLAELEKRAPRIMSIIKAGRRSLENA